MSYLSYLKYRYLFLRALDCALLVTRDLNRTK